MFVRFFGRFEFRKAAAHDRQHRGRERRFVNPLAPGQLRPYGHSECRPDSGHSSLNLSRSERRPWWVLIYAIADCRFTNGACQ